MIHFVLDALEAAGVKQKIVVVGHQSQLVEKELAGRSDSLKFVLQAEQLGTGHAVQVCKKELEGVSGPTMVVAGDSPLIQPASLLKLLEYFNESKPSLLLGTLEKEDPTGLGRVVRDSNGNFTGIVEHKDASEEQLKIREVNMSTYLFNTPDLLVSLDQLQNDNAQAEYYLTDCASLLHRSDKKVEALAVLQECEALSINNADELKLVDERMRAMGYA